MEHKGGDSYLVVPSYSPGPCLSPSYYTYQLDGIYKQFYCFSTKKGTVFVKKQDRASPCSLASYIQGLVWRTQAKINFLLLAT
jgi:hypothetical protein